MKNYYKILSLDDFQQNVSIGDVAYNKLAEICTLLERNDNDFNWESFYEKIRDIKEAYEVLSNNDRRYRYNAMLKYPELTEQDAVIRSDRDTYSYKLDRLIPTRTNIDYYIDAAKDTIFKVNSGNVMWRIVSLIENIYNNRRTRSILNIERFKKVMEYVIENNDDSEIQLKALYLGHSISNHIICNVHTDECYIKIVKFLSIYENYQYELSEVIEKALLKEKKENNKTLNKVKKIINRKENSEILLVDKIVSDYIDKKLEEEEERNKPKRKVCIKILRTPTLD